MWIFTPIFGIIGVAICFLLSDIKIELRYRNTLLKKQNEILERKPFIILEFGSGSGLFAPTTTIPSNPLSDKLIAAIRDQIGDTPPHLVYVIDIVFVIIIALFCDYICSSICHITIL